MGWVVEAQRQGVTLESFSDDLGIMGTPGTWYRVNDGGARSLMFTRNRGDALRWYQRDIHPTMHTYMVTTKSRFGGFRSEVPCRAASEDDAIRRIKCARGGDQWVPISARRQA